MVENRPQGPEAQAKQSIFMIDGMPSQKSKHPFWCGWSSASQLVQYHGYSELTLQKKKKTIPI